MSIDRYSEQIDPNWWKSKPVRRKLLSMLYRPVYFLKLVRKSVSNCLTYGPLTRDRYGLKNIAYDACCQFAISWLYGFDPIDWFAYRYEKKDWSEVSKYSDIRLIQGWLNQNKSSSEDLSTCKDKIAFNSFCRRNDVSSIPFIGYFEAGKYTAVSQGGDQRSPDQDLIVKPSASKGGEGIRILSFEDGAYSGCEGASRSWGELRDDLAQESRRSDTAILVQPLVRNHRDWRHFTSGGLATVRLLTGRFPTGHVEGLLASLRMPVGSSQIDSFSRGNLASSIDMETGALGPAFSRYPLAIGRRFRRHPDTRACVEGARLPAWPRLCEYAVHLHEHLEIPILGLDLTLTQQGVCVVEANPYYGRTSLEIPHGKPLGETKFSDVVRVWMEASSDPSSDCEYLSA